jgi:hypothetical protein
LVACDTSTAEEPAVPDVVAPAVEAKPTRRSSRPGFDESLPPGHGWTRSPRGPLVPPRDGSPHGPAPEPTLQDDGMMCSTWSCWDPSLQPAGTEQAVRNMIAAADVVVMGEYVGTTRVYGSGNADGVRELIAAGGWVGQAPSPLDIGWYNVSRIRVVHWAKGPGGDEVLMTRGGRWVEGQRIILFGIASDPTEGFPENMYHAEAELHEGLCVRSGDPVRENMESCQGRYKVPWDQLEAIIVAQSGESDEVGR